MPISGIFTLIIAGTVIVEQKRRENLFINEMDGGGREQNLVGSVSVKSEESKITR